MAEKRRILSANGYESAAMLGFGKPLATLSSVEFARLVCLDVYEQGCDVRCAKDAPSKVDGILRRANIRIKNTADEPAVWPYSGPCPKAPNGRSSQR